MSAWTDQPETAFNPSCCDGPIPAEAQVTPGKYYNQDHRKSATFCGCDEGADHKCERHSNPNTASTGAYRRDVSETVENHNAKIEGIHDSGKRMTFSSGSMRDPSDGKIKWSRVTFGPMHRRWAEHLTKAEAKYPDPTPGVPNFSLIESEEEFFRYKESAYRHFMDWFYGKTNEDHAAAVFFNINGVEIIKAKRAGITLPTWCAGLAQENKAPSSEDLGTALRYEEELSRPLRQPSPYSA